MRSSPGVELTAVRFINLIFFLVHPNIHVSGVGTGKGGRGKFSTANKNEARSFFAQAFFALEKTRSAGASSAVADDDADDGTAHLRLGFTFTLFTKYFLTSLCICSSSP